MVENILKIENLSKKYGKLNALNNLSLEVNKGMIFGILGPNGSGKTTTLGILLGVINETSGSFSWFNNGMADINRKRIGALLETPNFYPYLSAVKNLEIVGRIKGVNQLEDRITYVLKAVHLFERKEYDFRTYSLGMKQRLAIASALLADPDVLVLDEPTNGLDPQGIAQIRDLILDIANQGKTIIIASHQLDEIEKVCTDVLILRAGQMLSVSPLRNLIGETRQIKVSAENLNELRAMIEGMSEISILKLGGDGIYLSVPVSMSTAELNKIFFEKGLVLSHLVEMRKSLEDQFLEMIKQ